MPNVNVTYAEMQAAARQLQAGEQTISGDLARLKRLVDQLVAGGYVTDSSSKHFQVSYEQFNTGATKMIQGLNGMSQYLDAAVARVFAVKARPRFNPLIVHVLGIEAAERYAVMNDMAWRLAEAFWPGPLSLVLNKRPACGIADLVSAGLDTIALRSPAHPVAQALLAASALPIAAPSANRSGRVSPTTAAHVAAELGELIGEPINEDLVSAISETTEPLMETVQSAADDSPD